MAHEGVPLVVIQRQLGHANLGITSVYLQGIDSSEIIQRRPWTTVTDDLGHRRPRDEAIAQTPSGRVAHIDRPDGIPAAGEYRVRSEMTRPDLPLRHPVHSACGRGTALYSGSYGHSARTIM
jgi:hypothetical protein